MSENTKLAICGAGAGIVNGLLGSGGGLVLVPLFLSWIKLDGKKAFATSVSVTAAVCLLGGNTPPLKAALPYIIGGGVGGIAAGFLLRGLSVVWLRRIFGALLVVGGIKALL